MYRIMLDDNTIYYPNDDKAVLDDITLNLELNTAGTLTFSSTASAISECEKDFGLSFWMNLPVISTAIASRFSL